MTMAKTQTETEDPSLAAAILKLAESFGASQSQVAETLAVLQQNQRPREVNFGDTDYQEKLRRETQVLKRPAFQNGFPVNPSGLSDEVIDRLATVKPGKYLGGAVTVAIDGNDGIHLIYKNKTVEQRMAFARLVTSFSDLVNKIWSEMHPEPVAAA